MFFIFTIYLKELYKMLLLHKYFASTHKNAFGRTLNFDYAG